MALSPKAFLTVDEYELYSKRSLNNEERVKIEAIINATTVAFEKFCNRPLLEQTYSYDPASPDFNKDYSVFDGVYGPDFFLPTYPVSSVTSLIINGRVIPEAEDYKNHNGFFLYKKSGRIKYLGGFGYGEYQNINITWTGGYSRYSDSFLELQYLTFEAAKSLFNSPNNPNYFSEKIGNYSYSLISPSLISKFRNICPPVLSALYSSYRKEVI